MFEEKRWSCGNTWKAEDGRIADCYNLVELTTSSYAARTRNIEESDDT